MTSFLAIENVPKAFLENMAIDDILSHFQSSKINTASVTSTPPRLVKPALYDQRIHFQLLPCVSKQVVNIVL
ncbi:MAG: hypothetical protein KZQ66_20000 [Candidatus Thiodiazotropha sp. (ex Lucinoma aequizonata)]|nr:hypothetical protein [Candidatus Thiodiazotropha sp. (ex Lucinoma aequizonata)]MCU7888316.1 hypothetical protein [Candidatus Thiodiazotropha sp. (ex Lucinoma aequizonata)]MCU7903978.1 hypothetical protein [Candidatus Thiodiazotropha sp. (ex Lucinoma aequizonata)]MCU7908339.1 hypothetical protein [Candidatus Thiodiazotropha sp. (ex Lucinoma aequizonata)]